MKSTPFISRVAFFIFLLLAEVAFAQKENSVYPYGGIPDKSRKEYWMNKPPLNFNDRADFSGARFDSLANFWEAQFKSRANFRKARFDSRYRGR